MRGMLTRLAIASTLVLASTSCGSDSAPASPDASAPGDATTGGELPPAVNGFQIRTPDIQLAPGQEATYCYYFHTPNTAETVVRSWQSSMTPGSHHMILYFTSTAEMPDGTLDPSGNCGGANLNNLAVWTYAAQSPEARADMPADDGAGKPVGMPIPAGQAAAMQLHYLNATDGPLTVHAMLNANGYAPGTAYTQAAAYVTYNTKIDIPPGPGSTSNASGTCAVPAGAKFFTMSTHSHKQSVGTQVMDGTAMVQMSTDWEHPTTTSWAAAPFFSFTSGSLAYRCNYLNETTSEIKAGPSAQTNEMCMAIGYFFPATGSKMCLNSLVVR
jgi:copper type II ascorbate-dependent monooxygenase-like protein